MRDFGWQSVERGLVSAPRGRKIRLRHAADPSYLERRLGHLASKGCIRILAGMNRFRDFHDVLDADYERAA